MKWKWLIIFGSIGLACYALVPTLFHFPELRELAAENNQPLPWYVSLFPEKGLNLGLDLRGGIYVEMEVMVEEGINAKLDLLLQDVAREFKRLNIVSKASGRDEQPLALHFDFETKEARETALQAVEKTFPNSFGKSQLTGQGPFTLQLFPHENFTSQLHKDIISQAVQAVRNRVDRYGLAEPTVQRHGENKLVVELPGVQDPERALKIIQQAGKLEFKMVDAGLTVAELGDKIAEAREKNKLSVGYSADEVKKINDLLAAKLPKDTEVAFELVRNPTTGKIVQSTPFLLKKVAAVTGDMLKNAFVQNDPRSGEPYVSIAFNPEGAKNFADLTTENVGKKLAILLDGNVMSAPVVREPIRNGEARIDLGAGDRDALWKEARDLTLVLQEGALPARLKELTKNVIGPTLGKESIQKSLQSIVISTLVVMVFMAIYYSWSGVLANIAVLLNTLFLFALLAMFQATLTLPGMAGVALTVGMAVDANVLIFERMREELQLGLAPREVVDRAYGNAMRAIIDSNITTIIAGIILYQFGTGPIRGFAVTLIVGLVCNLFTAVYMTRVVYDYFTVERRVKKIYV